MTHPQPAVRPRWGRLAAAGSAALVTLTSLLGGLGVLPSFADASPPAHGAIRDSARRVLKYAEDNALLHAVVSATHGADTELLPLLTTHSEYLLEGAKFVVAERVAAYDVDLPEGRLEASIDMVVRLVLSHVMQPSAAPARTADDIAWIAERVLG